MCTWRVFPNPVTHVQCNQRLPPHWKSRWCLSCKGYQHVLSYALAYLKKCQETQDNLYCDPESHANHKYLNILQGWEECMHLLIRKQERHVIAMLSRQTYPRRMYKSGWNISDDLSITNNTSTMFSANEIFFQYFGSNNYIKASHCKSKKKYMAHCNYLVVPILASTLHNTGLRDFGFAFRVYIIQLQTFHSIFH